MNNYLAKDIELLKEGIKANELLKETIVKIKEKDYRVEEFFLPNDSDEWKIDKRIKYYNAVLEVATYYQEKLGDREYFDFGKYTNLSIDICNGNLRCWIGLKDNKTESKLYDGIFGSHSGINEWYRDKIVPLLSVFLGDTTYSRAFGSFDLTSADHFFDYFGKNKRNENKFEFYWDEKDFLQDIKTAKAIIDWFDKLSLEKDLFKDFDKVLDNYFDNVYKYNDIERDNDNIEDNNDFSEVEK